MKLIQHNPVANPLTDKDFHEIVVLDDDSDEER